LEKISQNPNFSIHKKTIHRRLTQFRFYTTIYATKISQPVKILSKFSTCKEKAKKRHHEKEKVTLGLSKLKNAKETKFLLSALTFLSAYTKPQKAILKTMKTAKKRTPNSHNSLSKKTKTATHKQNCTISVESKQAAILVQSFSSPNGTEFRPLFKIYSFLI
jgi:hypothetical protein